jgi:hypothetical protein
MIKETFYIICPLLQQIPVKCRYAQLPMQEIFLVLELSKVIAL